MPFWGDSIFHRPLRSTVLAAALLLFVLCVCIPVPACSATSDISDGRQTDRPDLRVVGGSVVPFQVLMIIYI